MTSHKQTRAWSLVEFIVTMAVIVVLAALLSPVLGRSLQRAQTAKCAAGLRTIGMGVLLYAAEHNDRLPDALSFGITSGDPIITNLAPYTGTGMKIWECPANRKLTGIGFTGYVQGNYASAFYFGHPQTEKSAYTLMKIRGFDREKQWLLEDMDGWNYANAKVQSITPEPVHHGGRNVLYVDGRVEWVVSKPNVWP